MSDATDAPETGADIQLPEDHPLVKTLAAQKETIKQLKGERPANLAELREKADKYDQAEQANRSELEKAIARADKAEAALAARNEADQVRKLAEEVAHDKGLADPSVLAGTSRDELEAHADRILALLPKPPKGATDASGGDRGDDIEHEEATAKEIASNIRI